MHIMILPNLGSAENWRSGDIDTTVTFVDVLFLNKAKTLPLSLTMCCLCLQAHTSRRTRLMSRSLKQKKMTEEAKQKVWEERFQKRAAEQTRLAHDDSLKFFQVPLSYMSNRLFN